ncbi:hypothetical protein PFISCL1PPCAC_22714, partial [Pristionchus fissidentatus]
LQFLEVSRYFQYVVKEDEKGKAKRSGEQTYNPSTGFRSRYGSDASTLTVASQAELLRKISLPEYPVVAVRWSSRGLMLLATIHALIIFVDIFLLNTTDSRRWRNENVQAYMMFSLLILVTNFSMPLVIAAVLLKQNRALTLFASFSIFWTFFAYGIIIKAYSDFDNPISSQPAGSLTLLTLLLTLLDCVALIIYFFTRFVRYKTFAGFFTRKIDIVSIAKKHEPSRKFGLFLPMTTEDVESMLITNYQNSDGAKHDALSSVASSVVQVSPKFTRQRSKIQPPINYI